MDLLPSAYYQFCVRACISFRIWGWLHAAPLVVPPLSPGREDGQLFVDLIFFAVATLACVISWVDVTYGAEPGAAKFIGMLTGVVLGNQPSCLLHLKMEPRFSPTGCFQLGGRLDDFYNVQNPRTVVRSFPGPYNVPKKSFEGKAVLLQLPTMHRTPRLRAAPGAAEATQRRSSFHFLNTQLNVFPTT